MPFGPRRTPYSAVIFTLGAIALIGFMGQLIHPYVPPSDRMNELANSDEDFLQAASQRPVRWRTLASDPFAEARRTDKLIMLCIGSTASRAARQLDQRTLADRDVVDQVNRDCIPVRIDVIKHPAWASAFLPYMRGTIGADPYFSLVFLDTDGELLSGLENKLPPPSLLSMPSENVDRKWLLDQIKAARDAKSRRHDGAAFNNIQTEDLQRPDSSPEAIDVDRHLEFLRSCTATSSKGFVFRYRQWVYPSAYEVFLRRKDQDALHEALDPLLLSSQVDWLDGGFFHACGDRDFGLAEFDKFAIQNAEMASVLGKYGSQTENKLAKFVARDTIETLLGPFVHEGQIAAYRVGDGSELNRSPRSSFPVREIRNQWVNNLFSEAERDELKDDFGLRVETNSQMLIRPSSSKVIDLPNFNDLRSKLRASHADIVPTYGGFSQLDIHASCLARILEACRALQTREFDSQIIDLLDNCETMRAGDNDVIHDLSHNLHNERFLRDYLAYADCQHQAYLNFGRIEALQSGYAVLDRAIFLFGSKTTGEFIESQWNQGPSRPAHIFNPNLLDDMGESSLAKLVRLTSIYSRLGRLFPELGFNWRALDRVSRAIVTRYGSVVNASPFDVSGMVAATMIANDTRTIIVVGNRSFEWVRAAESRFPTATVLPLVNSKNAPGYYLLQRTGLLGPLTLDEIERTPTTEDAPRGQ